jgi:hypothetical protein
MRRIMLSMAMAAALVVPAAEVANASGHASGPVFKPRYTINNANLGTGAAAGLHKTLATFHDTFQAGGQDYGYYMVGADPFTSPNKSTTVDTLIIPININLESGNGGGDYNASGIVDELLGSPLYQNYHFASGHTQLIDANQRAEFWTVIENGYHLLLRPTVADPVTIDVPADQGEAITTATGVTIADVSFAFWTSALKTVAAQTSGIQADILPIFLTKDMYLYFGDPNNCCVLGYHGAYKDLSKNLQTFAWASYGTPNAFGPSFSTADITALSHEVAEWANDPFTISDFINIVPNWESPYAPQYGCNSFLEVGDPVAGLAFQVHMRNGLTYHPEDEVFFSWFAQQVPSIAIDGRYTFIDTFPGPNTGCS